MGTSHIENPYILAGRYDGIPANECEGILDGLEACIEKLYHGSDYDDACLRRDALLHRMHKL